MSNSFKISSMEEPLVEETDANGEVTRDGRGLANCTYISATSAGSNNIDSATAPLTFRVYIIKTPQSHRSRVHPPGPHGMIHTFSV